MVNSCCYSAHSPKSPGNGRKNENKRHFYRNAYIYHPIHSTNQRNVNYSSMEGSILYDNSRTIVLKPIRRERVVEVMVEEIQEKIINVPQVQYVDKFVEVIKPIIKYKIKEVKRPVYVEQIKKVNKIVEEEKIIEVPEIQYVDKYVDVPTYVQKEKIVEVAIPIVKERLIPVLNISKTERIQEIDGVDFSKPEPVIVKSQAKRTQAIHQESRETAQETKMGNAANIREPNVVKTDESRFSNFTTSDLGYNIEMHVGNYTVMGINNDCDVASVFDSSSITHIELGNAINDMTINYESYYCTDRDVKREGGIDASAMHDVQHYRIDYDEDNRDTRDTRDTRNEMDFMNTLKCNPSENVDYTSTIHDKTQQDVTQENDNGGEYVAEIDNGNNSAGSFDASCESIINDGIYKNIDDLIISSNMQCKALHGDVMCEENSECDWAISSKPSSVHIVKNNYQVITVRGGSDGTCGSNTCMIRDHTNLGNNLTTSLYTQIEPKLNQNLEQRANTSRSAPSRPVGKSVEKDKEQEE
ncbi:Inner membrane complex protein [Babesia duncani]|uniref:Inner membrane complex protein n=1 Tax=Babesia duncani TaxID=323732 RepID=A0AAD9PMB0_9APIC|nr:Inner membrane complex protein [Babesia duncani]